MSSIINSITNTENKMDDILDKIKIPVFRTTMILINIIYVILFFGIATINQTYTHYLNIFIQIFVCGFLLIRFHPFRTHQLHKNDASLIFGSAILLLTNLGFKEFIFTNIKNNVKM